MSIEIKINGQRVNAAYIGWTPQPCTIRLTTPQAQAVAILLKSVPGQPGGGDVKFFTSRNGQESPTLNLTLPADGSEVVFFIGGKTASKKDQDVSVTVTDAVTGTVLGQQSLMVRVRKNANTLTDEERDRFLTAFVKLNLSQGVLNYEIYRKMHDENADREIHTFNDAVPRCSFLPWHRAYILDLERQLQKFDPSVALPYWKFDEPAPKLFTEDFMGARTNTGTVRISTSNPLFSWKIDNRTGIVRQPRFHELTEPALVSTDEQTVALGTDFLSFRAMEGDPHGYAHTSFSSSAPLFHPDTAPQDPLFFLLHCNVDRIWAVWQSMNNRYDLTNPLTYTRQGAFTPGTSKQTIGDYLEDTMWPWNGVARHPQPSTHPGGPFPKLPFTSTPSATPIVKENIDYQGYNGGAPSYADYEKITFTPPGAVAAEHFVQQLQQASHELIARHVELSNKLRASVNANEINSALNNLTHIDPSDQELVAKTFNLVKNKTEHKNVRVAALKKLTNFAHGSEDAVKDLITILTDIGEPVEVRRSALATLSTISFSSSAFNAQLPAFKDALRKLVDDQDPELVQSAVESLAAYLDERIQKRLVAGLQDPTKALVPDAKAIQLLGLDIRAEYYPVIREILAHSHNPDVMREAIHVLSGDPASQDLIHQILLNKNTDTNVRLSSIAALNSFNAEAFQPTLKSLISDQGENKEIRTASFNSLSLHNDLTEVFKDAKFKQAVDDLQSGHDENLKKISRQFLLRRDRSQK
ncbi:MAG TPA: tyrosinase family protein [Puia sp.]|nr:tyrosinase family protein [Puia sp.]